MDRLILHNDRICDIGQASISPASAGLIYGWGVFTTVNIIESRALAFERYWERIEQHAARARIPLELHLDHARFSLDRLIQANRVERGRARITITRSEAGNWRSDSDRQFDLLIFTSRDSVSLKREPTLTLSPYRVLSTGALAGVKRTAMIENLMAIEEARARGFDDAVLLNERGEIASTASANLFWSEGDELFTPSLSTGCVAGITRHFVCEAARRLRIRVTEGSFPIQRLRSAREVFLTSTARGIVPASGFDITAYEIRRASMSRVLSREYQKLAEGLEATCR
jgi:branched-subunit amino acid aminotransferase/4-amino-4-deoxychorismate lyase